MRKLRALFSHKGVRGSSPRITLADPSDGIQLNNDMCLAKTSSETNTSDDTGTNNAFTDDSKCSPEERLLPCGVCGRTFLPHSLIKHSHICQKAATKKRKQFDSSRQRREGTELAQFLPKNFSLPENSTFIEKDKEKLPPTATKMTTKTGKNPSPRTTPSKLLSATESSRCPHCGRGFGLRAWERHVAWCAEHSRLAGAPGRKEAGDVQVARSRLLARNNYRAPPVKSRRSLTREKYSLSRSASVESGVSERSSCGDNQRVTDDRDNNNYTSAHLPTIKKSSYGLANDKSNTARKIKPRLDDSYDPFLSAKRQMMDLMSSNTNLSKIDKVSTEFKKDLSPIPITKNPVQHSPKRHKSEITKINNIQSPILQRTRSLRSPSNNTYTYNGKIKSSPIFPNNQVNYNYEKKKKKNSNSNENIMIKSENSSTKYKNEIVKIENKTNYATQNITPKFQNYTEKHRIIKLEPVDIASQNQFNNNNINILDNSAIKNGLSTSQEYFIDPRLINDKIPKSVQKLIENADLLSSTESLVCERFPKTFSSFTDHLKLTEETDPISDENSKISHNRYSDEESNTPTVDDLSAQYDKIMFSLEQSMTSQCSTQDEDSLYNDLEKLMSAFEEQPSLHINAFENNSRYTKDSLDGLDRKIKSRPKIESHNTSDKQNARHYNKSISLNFSSVLNNPLPNPVFPTSMKRSNSLYDSNPKPHKENGYSREVEYQLEDDIMRSLKDIDKLCASSLTNYEDEKVTNKDKMKDYELNQSSSHKPLRNQGLNKIDIFGPKKKESREASPDNYSMSGTKSIADSAYGRSSLSRTSPVGRNTRLSPPRKLSLLSPTVHAPNLAPHRDLYSLSPPREAALSQSTNCLSSSGSEASLPSMMRPVSRTSSSIMSLSSRTSKFCHECGNRFPIDTAKFCIECGVRRLMV